jgi:hypothetical protein
MQNYNQILSISDVTEESGITEPVTLTEVKNYLRLEGFQDTDESDSTPLAFTDDDDLLEDIIMPSAREYIEQSANVSLIPHTYEVVLTNLAGMIQLPHSPIGEITTLMDEDEDEILEDDYTVIGNNQKFLKCPRYENMTITYETTPLNGSMYKLDILRMCAFLYTNRGDIQGAKDLANSLTAAYTRKSWLV